MEFGLDKQEVILHCFEQPLCPMDVESEAQAEGC